MKVALLLLTAYAGVDLLVNKLLNGNNDDDYLADSESDLTQAFPTLFPSFNPYYGVCRYDERPLYGGERCIARQDIRRCRRRLRRCRYNRGGGGRNGRPYRALEDLGVAGEEELEDLGYGGRNRVGRCIRRFDFCVHQNSRSNWIARPNRPRPIYRPRPYPGERPIYRPYPRPPYRPRPPVRPYTPNRPYRPSRPYGNRNRKPYKPYTPSKPYGASKPYRTRKSYSRPNKPYGGGSKPYQKPSTPYGRVTKPYTKPVVKKPYKGPYNPPVTKPTYNTTTPTYSKPNTTPY